MLYVVFSFVFIKYVNDRFLLNLVDRSTLRSHLPPSRLFLLSHPAWVTRSLQEVVPSFAVAKVYQIPNTNQILTRKTSENIPQSCTHFPLNKTLTTTEKNFAPTYPTPPLSPFLIPTQDSSNDKKRRPRSRIDLGRRPFGCVSSSPEGVDYLIA